jgi:hypothetical protein
VVELIEESDLRGGERIPVVLIAFHLFHEIGVGVFIIVEEGQMAPSKYQLMLQDTVCKERTDVPVYEVEVTKAPEVIVLDIVVEDITVCLFIFTELIGTVKHDGEFETLLCQLLKLTERHLVDDDIPCGLNVSISEKHIIYRLIFQC